MKITLKPKEVTSWDVLDALWEEWEMFWDNKKTAPKTGTMKDWTNSVIESCFPDGVDKFHKENGINKFLYEFQIVYRKPNRESVKWLHGEHAFLYNVFGCEEHKVLITTYDDHRVVWDATTFCPMCNKDIILDIDKFALDYDVVSDEIWDGNMSLAKFSRKLDRKNNIRYYWKNPKRWVSKTADKIGLKITW